MSHNRAVFGSSEPALELPGGEWLAFAAETKRSISAGRIRDHVERLPAPRNRQHHPDAMMEADRMLIEAFQQAGWIANRQPFEVTNAAGRLDYASGHYAAGARPVTYRRLVGGNIVAIKHGTVSGDVILVGAHHDTIRDSRGADDNTASVAALLELACVLGPHDFRDTVILAAFDMEELGMFGSRELVNLITQTRSIRGAIVYETMGYTASAPGTQNVPRGLGWVYPEQMRKIRAREFRGDWTAVLYRQQAVDIARTFGGALVHAAGPDAAMLWRDPADLPLVGRLTGAVSLRGQFSRSDHLSFWQSGIAAILVTDTANFRNPHYHRASDAPDTLDYDRLAAIVEATAVAVARTAGVQTRAVQIPAATTFT